MCLITNVTKRLGKNSLPGETNLVKRPDNFISYLFINNKTTSKFIRLLLLLLGNQYTCKERQYTNFAVYFRSYELEISF